MLHSFTQTVLTDWLLRQTASSGFRKVASLDAAIASEIGNVRSENQDRVLVAKCTDGLNVPFSITAIADGMGGMIGGAEAASIALGSFVSKVAEESKANPNNPQRWVKHAMVCANRAVYERFNGDGGTTFCAAVVSPNSPVIWTSAGDSRIYSMYNETVDQISVDDTLAGQLRRDGLVSPNHAKLLQFVGMGTDFLPHVERIPNQNLDTLICTTDGAHYLAENPKWFSDLLIHAKDLGTASKRLVELAKWCGGPDNATVAMIKPAINHYQKSEYIIDRLMIWDAFGELQLPTVELKSNKSTVNTSQLGVQEQVEENEKN